MSYSYNTGKRYIHKHVGLHGDHLIKIVVGRGTRLPGILS